MAFSFRGVFFKSSSHSLAAMETLFRGYARNVSEPFHGIGVSCEQWAGMKDNEDVKAEILRMSGLLGEPTIIFVYYSTFGGPVEYCYGFACKNGEIIKGSEMEKDDDWTYEVLNHLVGFLDVQLQDSLFAPFRRGYFPDT